MPFLIKIAVSALVVATVSEIAKRSTPLAAILAALPLNSFLIILWLYHDTKDLQRKDLQRIIDLSTGILWSLLPTILFFIALPMLLRAEFRFSLSLALALAILFVGYGIYMLAPRKFGVRI